LMGSYRRVQSPDCWWERGRGFLEAVEADPMIGLIHDSYRGRARVYIYR
jgi:hypothetical protein